MTKQEFAKLYVQESLFYYVAQSVNFKGKVGKAYHKFSKMVSDASKTVEGGVDTIIYGFCNDEDISHYDIDEVLRENFGDDIMCDSEIDGFYAYCNANDLKKIEKFLKVKYPTLGFKSKPYGDRMIFNGWDHGIRYCEEHGIEVSFPDEYMTDDVQKFIALVKEKQLALANAQSDLNALIGDE